MIDLEQVDALDLIFQKQEEFQRLLGYDVPVDDPYRMAHHLLGMVSEIGEVSQADKRWKTNGRNRHYDKEEKLLEIADVFIYLVNVCLYSEIPAEHFASAVIQKIRINKERYEEKLKEEEAQ